MLEEFLRLCLLPNASAFQMSRMRVDLVSLLTLDATCRVDLQLLSNPSSLLHAKKSIGATYHILKDISTSNSHVNQ